MNNNNHDDNDKEEEEEKEDNVYGAVIMSKHFESSPGSYDECGNGAKRPPTLSPGQPMWDSNLGPLTRQSGMLPLDHCDLQNVINCRQHQTE